jgi:hypothetical protein
LRTFSGASAPREKEALECPLKALHPRLGAGNRSRNLLKTRNSSKHRWKLNLYYRTEKGTLKVERWINEFAEMVDLVEFGPHWDTIEKIEVFRINPINVDLTVERADVM